jgi:hypothetical protein
MVLIEAKKLEARSLKEFFGLQCCLSTSSYDCTKDEKQVFLIRDFNLNQMPNRQFLGQERIFF